MKTRNNPERISLATHPTVIVEAIEGYKAKIKSFEHRQPTKDEDQISLIFMIKIHDQNV